MDGQIDGGMNRQTNLQRCDDASNKAGYTANTSCGRVGWGANAHFHFF